MAQLTDELHIDNNPTEHAVVKSDGTVPIHRFNMEKKEECKEDARLYDAMSRMAFRLHIILLRLVYNLSIVLVLFRLWEGLEGLQIIWLVLERLVSILSFSKVQEVMKLLMKSERDHYAALHMHQLDCAGPRLHRVQRQTLSSCSTTSANAKAVPFVNQKIWRRKSDRN
jgi:hypothetical protein